jgi:tRNA/tmRNA/rRNA uracil-C5-methylase (TrmA/RlmC/RlmD family)
MADRDGIICIGDDPFKISYMEYDTDRYEELLQSKIDTVMAKLPSSIKAQIVSTDIIRSPVKHFRQRCRFAVMPLVVSCSKTIQAETDLLSQSQSSEVISTSCSKTPNTSACGLNAAIIPSSTLETTEAADCGNTSSQSNNVNTSLIYVLWENGGPNIYVDAFPIASIAIYNAMPLFLAYIQTTEVLRNNLRAINFLSTRNGDLLATLIYDLEMGETWEAMATEMCSELGKNDCIVFLTS